MSLHCCRTEPEMMTQHCRPNSAPAGQPGEQHTMFFKDPSGNALEFKAMTKPENLFAKYTVSD